VGLTALMTPAGFCHEHHSYPSHLAAPSQATEPPALPNQLGQPAYWHVLLNPFPIYGMMIGALLLLGGILGGSVEIQKAALLVVTTIGGLAWPVVWLGQRAYDRIRDSLSPPARQCLELHMDRAETLEFVFYVTAFSALSAWFLIRKNHKAAKTVSALTLVLAILSVGAAGWIARAGGQIMHSEFRRTPPLQTK